jgi:hypothetical protein
MRLVRASGISAIHAHFGKGHIILFVTGGKWNNETEQPFSGHVQRGVEYEEKNLLPPSEAQVEECRLWKGEGKLAASVL